MLHGFDYRDYETKALQLLPGAMNMMTKIVA